MGRDLECHLEGAVVTLAMKETQSIPTLLTFTGRRRSFKLEMSPKPAGQDLISNQREARKTAVPDDITWEKKARKIKMGSNSGRSQSSGATYQRSCRRERTIENWSGIDCFP